ncbi:nuclear transport factor 2 family protein [Amycolatopsis sp. H20-H5]|uniref:nuclear transport factor 2 family protein n=1 Tax=Amycolatopsis sp. H20-H5 TaxID=3046309 RepID=UPI002DBD5C3D|nr:nuclear transport factor 2 family protein [Amycolatopsis sp. H20-H5]MEC3976577.1 nuclear transport factor 2 family protein [Amycolatopsis sp. H20-H5]
MNWNWTKGTLAVAVASAGVAMVMLAAPANAGVEATSSSTVSADAGHGTQQHTRAIVTTWESAWSENRPDAMAALFTRDATYTDLAFGATWHGQAEIGQWVTKTHSAIKNARVKVSSFFRGDNQIAIQWTFSGMMPGATKPFAVPATTIMKLRGERIVTNADYYNLADLLKQSGLPADWAVPGN